MSTTRLPIVTIDEPWASALVRLDREGRRIKALTVQNHPRMGRVVIRASERPDHVRDSGVWPFHGLGALDVEYHRGCLIGVVTIAHCELIGPGYGRSLPALESALDTWALGRWVWTTEDPRVLPRPLGWASSRGGAVDMPDAMLEASQPLVGGRGKDRDLVARAFGAGFAEMVDVYTGREGD